MRKHASSPRSSLRRWLIRGLIGLLILANIGVFGVLWWVRSLQNTIEENVSLALQVVQELTPSPADSRAAFTVLVLGSDSRDRIPEDWRTNFGGDVGRRADVIMLIKVIPEESRVLMLSIPRDLKVNIEGEGTNRINAAFAFGGAPLMVRTVAEATGLEIHHYVEVDFLGFASTIDELGGVPFTFPHAARDLKSGLAVEAGEQILDGRTALAYSRSRSYEEFRDGEWVSIRAGDIGRTRRQQEILVAVFRELRSPRAFFEAGAIVETLSRNTTVDPGLIELDLLELALLFRSLDAAAIDAVTLPTFTEVEDGRFYEIEEEPGAGAVLEAFARGAPLSAVVGGPIVVEVLNGNGVSGAASSVADLLLEMGVEITGVGDAESFDFLITQVMAEPSEISQAEAVLQLLGYGEVVLGPVPTLAQVLVIVGADAT